ncbi:histidine phosphatase superfamily [Xylariales sp. PMI_506]|nr:histidine phosphatase superfamily [Xylariales sp. PMI_506]
MGRPRLIILIRHGQSEGNKNRDIHQTIPDHRVKLTSDGWAQAHEAGLRLRSLLRADDTLQFFTSPYRRTRETTEGILSTLTSDDPDPSPFKRSNIKVYEEPRLREQDFGNFQPCSAEMERMWQERADYGHFFYRIPNGESAADAYDRVSGFNESLWRQFGEDDFASVCVLVTHGLMSRVFLMKWYHFSVEYFEDLRNVNHCEFLIMKKQQDSGKYILQNKLRTWSELRRERAALKAKEEAERERDGVATPTNKDNAKLERQNSLPVHQPRRWGGCPGGCNHAKHFKIRKDLAELLLVDEKAAAKSSMPAGSNGHANGISPSSSSNGLTAVVSEVSVISSHPPVHGNGTNGNGTIASRRPLKYPRPVNSSDDDSDDPRGHLSGAAPRIDVVKAREEVVSSPDGTPSFITVEDRLRSKSPKFLHVGRDFGGTQSGANSDADVSEDDIVARRGTKAGGAGVITSSRLRPNGDSSSSLSWKAQANKLGDAPLSCSDQGSEDGGDEREDYVDLDEDLDKAEMEDRSVRGSVY